MRSVRASAQVARSQALSAGASPTSLTPGDSVFRAAESLTAQGRVSDAVARFSTATALWAMAEQTARARAAAESAPQRGEAPPAAPPPAARPANDRPLIERVIADYAHAIESQDVAALRRAYPGLTAAQERAWQQFFRSVRNLRASLAVAQLDVAGDTAEATLSGIYEYENASTGQAVRTPVTSRAMLTRNGGGWRLSSIR